MGIISKIKNCEGCARRRATTVRWLRKLGLNIGDNDPLPNSINIAQDGSVTVDGMKLEGKVDPQEFQKEMQQEEASQPQQVQEMDGKHVIPMADGRTIVVNSEDFNPNFDYVGVVNEHIPQAKNQAQIMAEAIAKQLGGAVSTNPAQSKEIAEGVAKQMGYTLQK